jgi:biopolymer transport protein ExbB
MQNVVALFQVGGWPMYAIALCSIVALTIFLERLWALQKKNIFPEDIFIEVKDLVSRDKLPEATTLCRKDGSSLSRLLIAVLERAGKTREDIKDIVSEVGSREAVQLERYVPILALIATLAPLLGFLGTVIGMVDLFSSIELQGEVKGIGMIAGGIYKALYTTVAGLTVAIPAVIFNKICTSKVDQAVIEIEDRTLQIVDLVHND